MTKADWRANIKPAKEELQKLRALGLSVHQALDRMRGHNFTLPAVSEALIEVEGMDPADVPLLFDDRGDWDDF